jgi:CheY-like chemotaxis protein
MSNLSFYLPSVIDNLAEGTPDKGAALEPLTPLKTGLMPVIVCEDPVPETGTLPSLAVNQESKEVAEEQDASRTVEEAAAPIGEAVAVAETVTVGQTPASAEKTQSPTVLIVEDTTELAEVIQATLERINMVTFHESHGGRAISLLNEKHPDLVLLDINLPDMTGWKILDSIKEKHEKSDTRMPIVVVITAYGDPANRLVGKLQGVHSYLIKPFTADEVERTVTEALSGAAL